MFIHVRLIFPGVAGRTVPAYASRPGIFLPAAHLKISRCFMNFSLDNSAAFAIIINAVVAAEQMQWYRSGHNEHDWKSCCRQKRHEGSNPSHCASEKPCNHAGYRAFLLRQNGDLTIILTTNTPVLTDRAGCHSSTSGGSKLSIALRSLA